MQRAIELFCGRILHLLNLSAVISVGLVFFNLCKGICHDKRKMSLLEYLNQDAIVYSPSTANS